MAFGKFIGRLTNPINPIPREKKPQPYSFEKAPVKESKPTQYTNTNKISPFGISSNTPLFAFGALGNITDTQVSSNINNSSKITPDEKETARANFYQAVSDYATKYNLSGEQYTQATEFLSKHGRNNTNINTSSPDFNALPENVQKYLKACFTAASGVNVEAIPDNKDVKLEPIEALKD